MAKTFKYPGYTAILPPRVRYDQKLPGTAKLLYAEVTAMTDVTGFCWATNGYLGRLIGVSKDRAARLLGMLEEREYVQIEVIRNDANTVIERRIFITDLGLVRLPPPVKNTGRGPGENTEENDKREYILPPKAPHRGAREKIHKGAPDWRPEMFCRLWEWYPHDKRGNKQRAIRAWDALHPSDELIDTIIAALEAQSLTDEWQRGVGISHLSTYLNGYGWEGWEDPQEPRPAASTRPRAERRDIECI